MFVSRPQVFHGKDLRTSNYKMTEPIDTRVRGTSNIVASNIQTITSHTSDVTAVAFSKTTLATCSSDKTVRVWGAKDFTELPCSPLIGHKYMISCCQFSPSGNLLATCSTDGTLRMWDIKTGEVQATLTHPSKCAIKVCQWSWDGRRIVTGGDDDIACMWDAETRTLLRSYKGHDESVAAASFTPCGNYIVTGSKGGDLCGDLLVWDAQFGHGKPLTRVPDCHDLGVSCCQFSPTYGSASKPMTSSSFNQFLLATGGHDNLIKLWLFNGEVGSVNVSIKLDTMLPGHKDSVMWLSFSPNGKFIASCSIDRTARLWNVDTKQALLTIDEHTSYVAFCAFSTDSKLLATASSTVCVWQLTDTSDIMKNLNGIEEGEGSNDQSGHAISHAAMETWSVDDVCQWLEFLGLAEHVDKFRENAIDGKELLALSASDLESSLGVVALGHRNKIMRGRTLCQEQPVPSKKAEPSNTPEEFLCPITQEIMKDPVIASDGYTYDKPAIVSWMQKEARSPMTNMLLDSTDLMPNRTLKMMIQKFLQP